MNKQKVTSVVDFCAQAAPLIVLGTAFLAFIMLIIFKSEFYTHILETRWNRFPAVAGGAAVACITEFARMALLLMTFADFRNQKVGAGLTGLILSIGLVVYDMTSSSPISNLWLGESNPADVGIIIKDLVLYLVAISAGLEFRLALSGGRKKKKKEPEQEKPNPGQNGVKEGSGNGVLELY